MIRIGIADDHDLMRNGIKMALAHDPAIELILEAARGDLLLQHEQLPALDVLLLDLRMPGLNGLQVVEHLHRKYPQIAILIISSLNEPFHTQRLFDLGVKGYLLKNNATSSQLPKAIRQVHAGTVYYAPELLIKKLQMERDPALGQVLQTFSYQHMEIVKMTLQGATEDQIADALKMTRINVAKMKQKMNRALGKHTFQETVAYCIEHQLIEPGP